MLLKTEVDSWNFLLNFLLLEFNTAAVIGGSSAAGVVLLVVILSMLWKIREYNSKIRTLTAAELQLFEHGDPNSINEQLDVHEQTDLLPYDK